MTISPVPLIDIQQVCYTYPQQKQQGKGEPGETQEPAALRGVDLRIQQGEYVVLLGHNGSGKSTLARHCNALLLPDSGRVLIDGEDTRNAEKQRAIRESIGMIFQNPDNQLIATVVEDDVAWALSVRGLPAGLIRERVATAMEAVGISSLRQLQPSRLSGGQRQRVAIAGVLALRPRCIIADEATSMLDPLSRREITGLLHQLHERYDLTILQVTHLLEEAALAERVVVMEQGKIILDGPPELVLSDLNQLRELKLSLPEPLQLAARLREAGVALSPSALTLEAIVEELVH